LFLRKNPNYIGPGPYLERIEYLIGGNALLQYENGEVDWASPGAELQRVREDPVLSQELTEYPYKGLFFFYAKFAAPGLDDVRVRKAMAMAIDRETYCRVVANETCLPNGGFLPLTIAYFDPDIGVQFDPEGAKQLLADAGYPNGEGFPPVTIIHWYDQPEVEYVKQQLEANLGLTVVIDRVEVGLATSRSFDIENPAALQPQGWEASYNDPYGWYGGGILSGKSTASGGWYLPRHALTLEQMQGYNELIASVEAETDAAKKAELTQQLVTLEQSNTPDWVAEYVALAEEAVASTDEARRQEIWSQVQQIMFDNMPIIPMHTVRSFVLKKPYVKNMMVHPLLPNHGLYMNETYIDRG
jgi:peptide/nickel transport system substrate-binding protein/oligopeptide transport system substrate-binding protein